MLQKITVQLPAKVAGKLFELRRTSNRQLIEVCENWLANQAFSGGRVAASPSVAVTADGDLIGRIDAIRASIKILTQRIEAMLIMAADISALFDIDDDPGFDALISHRLHLERQEEALVSVALAIGLYVRRRPEADPRAILEVVEVSEAFAEIAA